VKKDVQPAPQLLMRS